jgi:hypothetical protein
MDADENPSSHLLLDGWMIEKTDGRIQVDSLWNCGERDGVVQSKSSLNEPQKCHCTTTAIHQQQKRRWRCASRQRRNKF